MSKDSVDAIVRYQAQDSGVLIMSSKDMFLYGKAKTEYKKMSVEAPQIYFDQASQTIRAKGLPGPDTTADFANKVHFDQDEMKTISDSMAYNMKTGKGITRNTFYQDGEIFLNARSLKKVDSNEVYAMYARFTTCNLDTPHYAFRARRMKVINNKLGVTGRVYPEIESVPIPMIFVPFGIFPLIQGRHSGVLLPSFTSREDFG
ncbi:MAG TPA: putative LPS assembly protein LptD, partial [Sediminibacterium sp.]|nr:putative LPS assembly protein LptD [Sediminibacterium sp.]